MVSQIKKTLLVFFLLFVLSACSKQGLSTSEAIRSTPIALSTQGSVTGPSETSYPSPENNMSTQSYPAPPTSDPLSSYPEKIDIPAPNAGTSVITGRVLEISNNEPYLAPSLILGELVFSSDASAPPLVGYSPETDPTAVVDRAGRFVFKDIKPGKYAIVVWTPGSQTLISDKQGNTIQVTVNPDKTINLGDVYVP